MRLFISVAASLGSLALFAGNNLAAADGPESFRVSDFTFQRPAGWTWIKTASPMRAVHLQVIQPQAREPADVVFYYFGPRDGGGTQANVERWLGQFKEPKNELKAKTDETAIQGCKVTFVQAEGTYMSGSQGEPKTAHPNYALVGAILEGKQGNVFVKMTGPASLTKAAVPAFKKMVQEASR